MALPFRGIAYVPLSIYTGAIRGADIWANILVQFAWGACADPPHAPDLAARAPAAGRAGRLSMRYYWESLHQLLAAVRQDDGAVSRRRRDYDRRYGSARRARRCCLSA